MTNKILIYILIFSFVSYIGCYSAAAADKYVLNSEKGEELIDELIIVTSNYDKIIIGTPFYKIINDTLDVTGINKSNVEIYNQPVDTLIAMKDINYIEFDKINTFRTIGCIGSVVFLTLLTIGYIWASEASK